MCTSPILIRNRRFKRIEVSHRNKFISVPCGQCEECLRKRAADLFCRARLEYDSVLSAGGSAFMCCLTYDNSNVPVFVFKEKKYMVFNKKHVIDFIKRLRTNLDRFFRKRYNCDAPDFKYLITSEYGSDPTRSHRPHYHCLFFFRKPISHYVFSSAFRMSLSKVVGKEIIPVFGRIFQCDILDPKRGGVRYSTKYICKDLAYANQDKIIRQLIKHYRDKVNQDFNIIENPDLREEFCNKCIRSRKDYRKAVASSILPYRHMLQFYMLSDDLGVSACLEKYGNSIFSLHILNFDGFSFSLPKLVRQRIEQVYGSVKFNELNKRIFEQYFDKACSALTFENKVSQKEVVILKDFVHKFVQPLSGSLYLVRPTGFCSSLAFLQGSKVDWQSLYKEFKFFDDNDFFNLRNRVYELLNLFDSDDRRKFRAEQAAKKSEDERKKYEQKKRNNQCKR